MSNPRIKAMFAPMGADMTDEVQAMAYVGSLGCTTTPETFENNWKSIQHLDMHLRIRFVVCAACYSPRWMEIRKMREYDDVFRFDHEFCRAVIDA